MLYYIHVMAVTKTQWTAMTWKERIEHVLSSYNLSKSELAQKLGVDRRSVNYWISGSNIPKIKYAKLLRSLCVSETFDEIKEESYMALHSMSADATGRLLDNACKYNDPMMKSMALYCLAVKVSAIIDHMGKSLDTLIIRINTLYGTSNASIIVEKSKSNKSAVVTVKAPTDKTPEFTLVVSNKTNDRKVNSFAFTVSDKSFVTLSKRIIQHLTK